MFRTSLILLCACVGITLCATLNKKEGYGGSSAGSYTAQSSYGTSGSSYDASNSAPSYSAGSESSYATGSQSYSSGSPSYGSGSYGGGGASGSYTGSEGGGGDSGNLYYYYYPVTNHSTGSQSYSSGSQSYGGAQQQGAPQHQQGYYPPAPVTPPFGDPLTGLLSLWGAVDFNSFILPALLIGGVALLLPAILNCDLELGTCVIPLPFSAGTGRKSRGMGGEWQQVTIPQMIDDVYRMYGAATESDQCMQRVVCEFGGMMRNVRGKEMFFSLMEQFAPMSMKKQLYVLKQGALSTFPGPSPTCVKFQCDKIDKQINKVE